MDNVVPLPRPHPPLEDWLPALRHTRLDGSLFWVMNEDNLVIDASPDVANAVGLPVSSYIGSYAHEVGQEVIIYPPLSERHARRERILKKGGSETYTLWANLPDRGKTCAVVSTTRITHPDNGKHYVLTSAHDITDIKKQLAYLRAPAFQGLFLLIIEKDGKVLAATDEAARFCNPALTRGEELEGAMIDQTDFSDMAQREAEELERSNGMQAPAHAIEWLQDGLGSYRPYAISRIAFPEGMWMIIMIPVPLDDPWMQLTRDQALKAPNVQRHGRLTPKLFKTLVDMRAGLSLEDAAVKRGLKNGKIVSNYRDELAEALGVDSVKHIMGAIKHTELGYLATVYSQMVEE